MAGCNLVPAAQTRKRDLWGEARRLKMWLPDRALNCFYTWLKIWSQDAGARREIDPAPWTGMPAVMLDGHAYEGKKANVLVTLLSGHYHHHLALSKLVGGKGWQAVRKIAHEDVVAGKRQAKQNTFFHLYGDEGRHDQRNNCQ